MAPTNQAAWLSIKKQKPLEIKEAPYPSPGPNELVVRNGAVAINPADMAKQNIGLLPSPWIKYPFIIGSDLAGEVVEIGSSVKRFKIGDRVVAQAVGMLEFGNKASEGAFQLYTVVREHLTARIPDSMTYEQACVIPLTFATASYGMFEKNFLGLNLPKVSRPPPSGKTIIITSGSSSVGSNAIQLAVQGGYEVYTTASPKNFEYCKRLGAAQVFDYHEDWVGEMIEALKGKKLAGALSINEGSLEGCTKILSKCQGNKFIAYASLPVPANEEEMPKSGLGMAGLAMGMMMWMGSNAIQGTIKGVKSKFIDGKDLDKIDCSVAIIYRDFLGQALAEGTFVPAPEPLVVGKGLDQIQVGLDKVFKGSLSAQKVVVSL